MAKYFVSLKQKKKKRFGFEMTWNVLDMVQSGTTDNVDDGNW